MENSSTPGIQKNNILANKIRKAAAYRTEGSQPNTMGNKKLFQIIAQNTKQKVATHLMEPHPGMPWQLYLAIQNPWCCTNTACYADTLAILEHFDHRHVCHL